MRLLKVFYGLLTVLSAMAVVGILTICGIFKKLLNGIETVLIGLLC